MKKLKNMMKKGGVADIVTLMIIVGLVIALIIAVVFSMFTWLPINSLGIVLFWGILIYVVYSYTFAKTLLLNFEYLFENK